MFFGAALLCRAASALAFEDIRYEIDARLDPRAKTIQATETVTFKNNSGRSLDVIYLRVYPNHRYSPQEKKVLYQYASYFKIDPYPNGFDPGNFRLESLAVTFAGTSGEVPFSFEGKDQTVLKVNLNRSLADGESSSIRLEFSARIPHRIGRYGWHQDTFALNRWYPILGVLDRAGWHNNPDYLLHMPYVSDAASYHLKFRVPVDYVVASGCDDVTEEISASGEKTITASASEPLRELTLAISKNYRVVDHACGNIKIKSYYLAEKDKDAAQRAAVYAAELLTYYGRRFGAYPYKQFSIAPVHLGYGGSQNAGIIFTDSRSYQLPLFLNRYFNFLIAHETGHAWFYNMVGNDEYRELWLDEGINSYWTMEYLSDKYGQNAKILEIPAWAERIVPNPTFQATRLYRYRAFALKGLDQPILTEMGSFYEPSLIFTLAYGKGSAVLDMLAAHVGQEKFDRMMRLYAERFKFRIATAEDFIGVAEEISGEDLGWFFDQWLYGKGLCDYAARRRGGELIIAKKGQVSMPVETKIEYSDCTQTIVLDGEKTERITLDRDRHFVRATVDPERKILDIDRVNNTTPRQADVRLVPLYHALYEIPLFLDDDRYAWITGPSFSQYGMGLKSSFQKPEDYLLYVASHYNFASSSLMSSVGFEKKNFLGRYLSWGVEFFNQQAFGDEEDDLKSVKLFLRQELAVPYSMLEANSHATLYLLHNRSLGKSGFLGSNEEARGVRYRQKDETIVGLTYHLANAGAFPDPATGFKLTANQEVGGHMLGGDDAFVRTSLEWDKYTELRAGHKLAVRLKGGGGHPKDKYLFYLGSDRQLRGYDFKDIQGSAMFLASTEYRFPLVRNIDARFLYGILNLDEIQGVVFFDAGSAWFNRFAESGIKKDAGIGLRFYVNVAGGAERVALRLDVARPLDGEDKDTHVWFGINQSF
ncbi:MAG: M1 family aminopeptidase [Candidatus Omnitrophota bacterium]